MVFKNRNPIIILIAGKARSGKNTVSKILESEFIKEKKEVIISPYTKYLKEYIHNITDWNIEDEKDLLKLLDNLNIKGIKFALSNVILSNGKENTLLKEWSSKYTTLILKRQYKNANYQKKNITDTIEVLIKNY